MARKKPWYHARGHREFSAHLLKAYRAVGILPVLRILENDLLQ